MLQTNSSKAGGKAESGVRKWATNKEQGLMDHKPQPCRTGSFTWFDMNLPYQAKSQMQLPFKRKETSQVSTDPTLTKSMFSRHFAIGFKKS